MPTDPANVCSLSKTGREGRTTKMTRWTHLGHRQHVLPFSAIAIFAVRCLIRREAIWNNYMPGREAEFETW
jgi:hypothetical protein